MNDEVPFVNVCTELAWALVVAGISRNPWFLALSAHPSAFSLGFPVSPSFSVLRLFLFFVVFQKPWEQNCR